jgi:hypothetical protein
MRGLNLMENPYFCPNCGADNICKLSIVYRNGITSSNAKISYDQDFLGINNATLRGQSQSLASSQASPPMHPAAALIGLIVVEFALYVLLGVLGLILEALGFSLQKLQPFILPIFGIAAVLVAWGGIACIIDYPADRARWNNSYHCQRCDTIFHLGPNDTMFPINSEES